MTLLGQKIKSGLRILKAVYNLPIPTSEIDFGNIKTDRDEKNIYTFCISSILFL